MGCDIHIFTEFKRDNIWLSGDCFQQSRWGTLRVPGRFRCYNGRCYELFSLLANVRNSTWGNVVPVIADPRGLPDDLSDAVQMQFTESGYHSESHFTYEELKAGWEKYKGSTIIYDATVDTADAEVVKWLELDWKKRGAPPHGYCANSSSKTAKSAKWQQSLDDIIGNEVRGILKFLYELGFDEDAKETRIVFGFDS